MDVAVKSTTLAGRIAKILEASESPMSVRLIAENLEKESWDGSTNKNKYVLIRGTLRRKKDLFKKVGTNWKNKADKIRFAE